MPLILDSLDIRQFRAFRHLQIEKLGRINLVVGKNNVGKSSFLEALWLYAYQGAPSIIWQILESRDEGRRPRLGSSRTTEDLVPIIKQLFYGRKEVSKDLPPIQIGPIHNQDKALSISLAWYRSQVNEEGARELKQLRFEDFDTIESPVLGLKIRMGKQLEAVYRFDRSVNRYPELDKDRCIFISATGLSMLEVGQLWDSISLTNLEEDVLASLRIIAPQVDRVSLISNPYLNRERERIPIVKVRGQEEPLPLRSLGEGMNRLFGITLALVNAKNGVLLIDEVESGLHYSVQPDVWRLIFAVAHRLNIQVFATTHSWDCIQAFQQAAQEDVLEEGVLTRLVEKKGEVVADLFDERELDIATREKIELR